MKWKATSVAIIAIVVIAAAALFAYFNYGTGIIEIKMTDPPQSWGEATHVYLNYSAIEIHRSQSDNESGWHTVVDKSAWINLTRTLDANQTIGAKNLQAGVYNLIRFQLLEARVTVSGINHTAVPPSGKLTVPITQNEIHVNAGQTTALLIDLNVKVEGSKTAGNFKLLVPAVRATPV